MKSPLTQPMEVTVLETELETVRTRVRSAHPVPVEKSAVANTSLHGGVFKTFAGINVAILGVFWMTFQNDAEALFMVAISGVYLAAYLATPYLMSRIGRIDAPQKKPFHDFLNEPFETWTGVLKGREALLQVLLIPIAILIAVAGMGLIIATVR